MPTLEEILVRLGAAELANWLGRPTITLLEECGLHNVNARGLAQFVIRQFGPARLLLESKYRNQILSALTQRDAQDLCNQLGLESSGRPHEVLCTRRFPIGGNRTKILFSYFGLEPPTCTQANPSRSSIEISPSYGLYDFQRRIWQETISILRKAAVPRVLIHMPTGSGKTRTAMAIICSVLKDSSSDNPLVVWLAHCEELCDQAAEEFERAWSALGDRPLAVSRHYGPYRCQLDTVEPGILIASLQLLYSHSLTHQEQFFRLGRRTVLLVMDEAHRAIAPSYAHLLNLLCHARQTPLLGLSATPGRAWLNAEEDIRLAEFFHHQKVSLRIEGYENPIDYLQHKGYLAKVDFIRIPYAPESHFVLTPNALKLLRSGFDIPESVIRRLGQDQKRNLLLISYILEQLNQDPNAKIIVFACSVEHARLIANLLLYKGVSAAAISSETPLDDRRRIIEDFRSRDRVRVLTNYGVLTTGFDVPRANVAVIARPTTSLVLYSQMVGRVIRGPRSGGNHRARVLTVVDDIPGFRSVGEAFVYWDDIW